MGVSAGARGIVAESGIQAAQVQFLVEQVVECVLEGSRLQLPGQVDRQEPRLGDHILVAGHRQRSPYRLCVPILLVSDDRRKIVSWDFFYSLVRCQLRWNRQY